MKPLSSPSQSHSLPFECPPSDLESQFKNPPHCGLVFGSLGSTWASGGPPTPSPAVNFLCGSSISSDLLGNFSTYDWSQEPSLLLQRIFCIPYLVWGLKFQFDSQEIVGSIPLRWRNLFDLVVGFRFRCDSLGAWYSRVGGKDVAGD